MPVVYNIVKNRSGNFDLTNVWFFRALLDQCPSMMFDGEPLDPESHRLVIHTRRDLVLFKFMIRDHNEVMAEAKIRFL